MIAYKLCRKLKNGNIRSLFINKKVDLPFSIWLDAENHPTNGFKERPFWHCTAEPRAPHLSMKGRVWIKCEIDDYLENIRPEAQGGLWFLSKRIKLLEIV